MTSDHAGVAALIAAVENGEQYSQLWQVQNIGDAEIAGLLGAMHEHHTFTHLGFFRCGLTQNQLRMLCEGLPSHVEHLLLQFSNVGDLGAVSVADLLSKPAMSLDTLYLCDDYMGDQGAIRIARALRENKSLSLVCLSDTLITGEGLEALREMLNYNSTLTKLSYPRTNILPSKVHLTREIDFAVANTELRMNWQRIFALGHLSIPRLACDSIWRGLPIDILRVVKDMLCERMEFNPDDLSIMCRRNESA
jgi:hypothetical protein